jgi:hypothetical protein
MQQAACTSSQCKTHPYHHRPASSTTATTTQAAAARHHHQQQQLFVVQRAPIYMNFSMEKMDV